MHEIGPAYAQHTEDTCICCLLNNGGVSLILRLHYVPGGTGSSVSSKRSVPWNFCHIYFSVFNLLSFLPCITISVTSRGSDKPMCHGGGEVRYGHPRSITSISTFYYGQLSFDQGATRFFFVLSRSATDET